MTIESIKNKTVAEFVTDHIGYAHIFKKYGIDFCCGGGISIEKACEKNSVAINDLVHDLQQYLQEDNAQTDYNSWPLSKLIEHIITIHHTYVLDTLPVLEAYAQKVAKVHGHGYPQLLQINQLVKEVSEELQAHLQKEETILFPYIRVLLSNDVQASKPHFGTIENPLRVMVAEHEHAGDVFKTLTSLTDNYTPPPAACNTFKALYHLLEEFEKDLHLHIHLENNILFPKALKLETS